MKNVIGFVKNRILLCTLIFAVMFYLFKVILNLLILEYRQWVFYFFPATMVVAAAAGLIQLINRIKLRWMKILSITIITAIIVVSLPYVFFVAAFSHRPEHIVTKNGYKMVAYVDAFMHTSVYYYDYKNFFIRSKQLRLYEDYGKGGVDPIKNKYGYTYNVENYTWYDDKGNPVQK